MNALTVIVPFRNGQDSIMRLLVSLPNDGRLHHLDIPTIIVDDVSDSPCNAQGQNIRVLRLPQRGYFSGAVNAGLAACDTDVLILNQDVVQVSDAWIGEIARLREKYAVIGDGVMNHPAWLHGYIQGTCMFIRRDAIKAVGGFNERDWPLWGATAEWQLRACRKGFKALPMDTSAWFTHSRTGRYGSSIDEFVRQEPEHADWAKRTPPMITVVMACYNYGRYLPDAITSLRGGMTSLGDHPGQTFAAWECIIVDDASTDETPTIAQGLADAWQGIHYIRLAKNSGTAVAYNTGIKAGHGRYYMPLSADDMLEPDALEKMYRILEADSGAMVYTDMQLFRDGQRGKLWQMKDYDFESLLERNHVPAGIMVSREAWRKVGGYPAGFKWGREDWAMAVALGRAGYCGVHIPEPLYLYRRAGQNRSARNQTGEWRTHFVAQMRQTFPDLYAGERPMACCGGARRPAQVAQRGPRAQAMGAAMLRPGEQGMTLIEYIGSNSGKTTWWGPVTSVRYVFGGSKKVGYVDDRDLVDMLALVQNHRPVFRRHVDAPTPTPAVKVVAAPVVAKLAPIAAPTAPVIVPQATEIKEAAAMLAEDAGHPELAPLIEAIANTAPDSALVQSAVASTKKKRARKPKNADAA